MRTRAFSLAMSNIAWSPDERLDAYRLMTQAGMTGLEIAPGLFFHAADDPFAPDVASAEQALREAKDYGLSLVSMQSLLFGVEGAALFEGKEARERLVAGLNRAIDLAGRFGIPNLVFGSPKQRIVPKAMPMEQAQDEAASVFYALGDRAMQAGTVITIEANPALYGGNFLTHLEEARRFVARVNHPAIAPILDLGAMHVNGEFATVTDRVAGLMPALTHVHVSEPTLAPAPARAAALAPVLKALDAAGYARWISIEMKRPQNGLTEVEAALSRFAKSVQLAEAAHA